MGDDKITFVVGVGQISRLPARYPQPIGTQGVPPTSLSSTCSSMCSTQGTLSPISTLPPELINAILEHGAEYWLVPAWANNASLWPEELRTNFLTSASLVCRLWREPAQRLMRKYVVFRNKWSARKFIKGARRGRRFTSSRFDVVGDGAVCDEVKITEITAWGVRNILSRLDGLRSFSVHHYGTGQLSPNLLSWKMFFLPNLTTLTSITLVNVRVAINRQTLPPSVSFSLRELVLINFDVTDDFPNPFTSLATSPHLRTFVLRDRFWIDLPFLHINDLESHLLNTGNHLLTLVLDQPSGSGIVTALLPVFSKLRALQNLTLRCSLSELSSILSTLPATLSFMDFISTDYDSDTFPVAFAHLFSSPSLTQLSKLSLPKASKEDLERERESKQQEFEAVEFDLLAFLRSRGVEVEWTEDLMAYYAKIHHFMRLK